MACSELERNGYLVSRILYSLLVLSFACASLMDEQPYCSLRYRRLCQGKGRHVGCQYPYPGPGSDCRNYTQIKFTTKLRHFIMNYVNRRRQRVAAGSERARGGALIPKPQIMMKVVWDRELAMLAQRLADQCSFVHDDCRATVRYPYSGQTVGEVRWRSRGESDAMSAQRAMRRVLDAWWGERRRVQPHQLIAPFKVGTKDSAWGHFSQLAVWALAAMGCGATRHGYPRRLLLVCDFSHTNMLGQSTLTPGDLAPCPQHYGRSSRSSYPLLCAPVRVPEQSESEDDTEYGTYEEHDATSTDLQYETVSRLTDTKAADVAWWSRTERITAPEYRSKLKNATKPNIIDKLEQELELTTMTSPPAVHTTSKYRKKFTTRRRFGDIRENNESESVLKSNLKINRPTSQPPPSTEDVTTDTLRRKWKQTRRRPHRPGADALVNMSVEQVVQHSSVASMNLDKEDMEQLFRDTGFHRHWKTKSLPSQ